VQPAQVPPGPLAIDTDAFSFTHARAGRYAEFSALVAGHVLAMPFPVVGELKAGAIKARWGTPRREALSSAIAACVVIPFDARIVDQWAELRAKLVNRLKGEGINDLWVAACCLVHDLPLVTNNLSDYQTIASVAPSLRLIHPDVPPPGTTWGTNLSESQVT
jgi:predicted nucleic acid-binding protein